MKKIMLVLAILCLAKNLFAQHFNIHGKIETISGAKNIRLASGSGNFYVPIQPDGSFEISGDLKESGFAILVSDSSNNASFWLDGGNYYLDCKEERYPGYKWVGLNVSILDGPIDAKIFSNFFHSLSHPRTTHEEIATAINSTHQFVDSIMTNCSNSKAIPQILRLAMADIGVAATFAYMNQLSEAQQTGQDGKVLEQDLKRAEKLDIGKYFEDFSMKTLAGDTFQLSSIRDKKLVLVEFWSSECVPCRAEHPAFVKWREKYADQGFEIVSISIDQQKELWQKAVLKDQMNWTNVSELQGWESVLAKKYFLGPIPYTILLDKDRKVLKAGNFISKTDIEKYMN